uniref:Uncharacterized protein n=1 Tax=Kapraunia schneideri TaxID=717899 RepID=A0A1Z1MSR8_9FLOR|nr:hypothetical protein [Kapraunia schneideri]ARW68996.1 hypothetical protein [Kapraunia schneideri]
MIGLYNLVFNYCFAEIIVLSFFSYFILYKSLVFFLFWFKI